MPSIASMVGWVFNKLTTLPADGVEGQLEYMNDMLYLRNSATWFPVGAAYDYDVTGITRNPRLWVGVGTVATTGDVTFTIPTGAFQQVHAAFPTVERASTAPGDYAFGFVRSLTSTQVIVRVAESKMSGVLIGGAIEGLETSTAAFTVKVLVIGF